MRTTAEAIGRIRPVICKYVPDSGHVHTANGDDGFLMTATGFDSEVTFTEFGVVFGLNHSIGNHLFPAFGACKINEINSKSIQEFLDSRAAPAKKTITEIMNLLRQILQSAVQDGYITMNPAMDRRLKNPSSRETSKTP